MPKNKELVSQTWNDLRSLNIDSFISPRYIVNKAIDIASTFIKEENDSRRIYKTSQGWKEIECINLIEVPITECPELSNSICKRLMKTQFRLPDVFATRYGNLIKHVASIDFGTFYDVVTPRQYKNITQREFFDNRKKYYFFIDGYIYIPNSSVEKIRVEAYFKYPWICDEIYQYSCESCERKDCLPSPLDYDFVCVDYLYYKVKAQLLKELAGVTEKIPVDENANLDSNIKSKEQKTQKE